MASAAPPILPISSAGGSGAVSGAPAPPPAPASGVPTSSAHVIRRFLSLLSDSARRSLANRRPWSELLDRTAFSRPDSLAVATSRLRKNLGYFRVNYLAIVVATLALSLLFHPFSLLLLIALLAAWSVLYLFRPADAGPTVLFGWTFSDRETLGGLVLLTVIAVFLTSIGSLIASAILLGAAVVCAHGAFRVPEDLFLDDEDAGGPAGGFLSILGGAASGSVQGVRL